MKRSKFNLSHHRLLTCNMGQLIPITHMEVLPGDTFQMASSALIRCSPMLAPVMHPVDVRIHHWFVPYRLLWDSWEDFITDKADPDFPVIGYTNPAAKSLADYLGLPVLSGSYQASALPTRAYQLIFNEWYRDQNLTSEAALSTGDGLDGTTATTLQRCAWEKDYFTSARLTAQQGAPVSVPMFGVLPVDGIGTTNETPANNGGAGYTVYPYDAQGTSVNWPWAWPAGGGQPVFRADGDPPGNLDVFVNASGASISVNDLREAMAMQRYAEARMRYGSRYTEYLAYLGVHAQDSRLQRPEYLGGGRQRLQFSEVLQTGPYASDDLGVANLYGHGIGALRSNRFRKFFPEHGIVMSLLSVRPKTIYQDGLPRSFNRRSQEDFWQKELQHIGQQEIPEKEIYADSATPDAIWGYQDRYDEYRRMESGVSGEFRTLASQPLDYWHFARSFSSTPNLNSSFVTCTPSEEPFADQSADTLLVMANHQVVARRMVAKEGTSFIF